MTHGEIRGTLFLLAIMAAIVGGCYINKSCSRGESPTPSTSQPDISSDATSLTTDRIDSVRMEQTAAHYDRKDSLRAAERLNKAFKSKRRQKSATKQRPHRKTTPTPSPLDRPI